jgi:hypothetical protein
MSSMLWVLVIYKSGGFLCDGERCGIARAGLGTVWNAAILLELEAVQFHMGKNPRNRKKIPLSKQVVFFCALQTLTSDAPVGTTIRPDASIAVDP